jgi:hypothetical protein
MQCSATLAPSGDSTRLGEKQRLHYRHPIRSLVYVTLEEGNGGIIRNLSEDGVAIQAVAPLQAQQSVRVRFDLLSPKTRLDVHAKVAWANASGQAGLFFLDLTPGARRQLNEWIFLNLLRGVEQAAPVLRGRDEGEVMLSGSVRPAIRLRSGLAREVTNNDSSLGAVWLPWWPRPVSSRMLSWTMDGLILLSAVLTFFCTFLLVAQTLPAWKIAVGLMTASAGFFAGLYWYLFAVMGPGTAGVRLARIVAGDANVDPRLREQEARFR